MSIAVKTQRASEYVPVKVAAAILSVSERTIWRMIADGQLTAHRFRRCTRLALAQVEGVLNPSGKAGSL